MPDLDLLVNRALSLQAQTPGRTILGIAGPPGSGKTTLVRALLAALEPRLPGRVAWLPMDGFHLADSTLRFLGRLDAKGAIDTFDGYGYLASLRRIHAETDHAVYAPDFDRTLEQPIAGGVVIPPSADLVLTEGNYLLDESVPWSAVRAELAEVWFCDVPGDARRERLVARHVEFGKAPEVAAAWVETVDEGNARRVERTRDRADLIVDTSGSGSGAA
ncbi:nucleoside/nucleotide kinase family protein [Cnuibacter sp. UC19_7]|uniref:nucleoside/nucleotide kinase family protein n=1 Tax=Cnuibacter sp. UC19_7 TaxID=3350166 RepID=UPI00366F866B